jgi:hypothetical protein
MTESRPRPQYGEYASPEEQARAIGIPLEHAPHVTAHAVPAAPSAAEPAQKQGTAPQQTAPQRGTAPKPGKSDHAAQQHPETGRPDALGLGTGVRVKRSRDTMITVVLLGLGLAWILLSIPGTSDLAGTLDHTYALQGYTGHYGPVAFAAALGLAINISSLVLWGVTCAVSIAVLRRHRRAFYIPLIGAVLSGLVVIALTLVAMFNDPGLLAYLGSLQK